MHLNLPNSVVEGSSFFALWTARSGVTTGPKPDGLLSYEESGHDFRNFCIFIQPLKKTKIIYRMGGHGSMTVRREGEITFSPLRPAGVDDRFVGRLYADLERNYMSC